MKITCIAFCCFSGEQTTHAHTGLTIWQFPDNFRNQGCQTQKLQVLGGEKKNYKQPKNLKMQTTCVRACSNELYIQTLWETLFPIINNHPYSHIWRALPPIRTDTGRQKLPSFFPHIMGDTALDNVFRTGRVHGPRDRSWPDDQQVKCGTKSGFVQKGPIQCQSVLGILLFWSFFLGFFGWPAPTVSRHAHFRKQMLLLSIRQYNCHNYGRHCSR